MSEIKRPSRLQASALATTLLLGGCTSKAAEAVFTHKAETSSATSQPTKQLLGGVACVTTMPRAVEGSPDTYAISISVLTDPGVNRNELSFALGGHTGLGQAALTGSITIETPSSLTIQPVVLDNGQVMSSVKCPPYIVGE